MESNAIIKPTGFTGGTYTPPEVLLIRGWQNDRTCGDCKWWGLTDQTGQGWGVCERTLAHENSHKFKKSTAKAMNTEMDFDSWLETESEHFCNMHERWEE